MIIVGKHIHGVTINPLEYILDDNGWVKKFIDKNKAKAFFREHGTADEMMEELVFEEYTPVKIGRYVPASDSGEEIIERAFYGQGDIFKDEEAYESGLDKICYIPELSDTKYTRQDFLEMCDNQENIARDFFDRINWQHLESLLEEEYANGEYDDCEKCGRMFACYDADECPHCNAPYISKEIQGGF